MLLYEFQDFWREAQSLVVADLSNGMQLWERRDDSGQSGFADSSVRQLHEKRADHRHIASGKSDGRDIG